MHPDSRFVMHACTLRLHARVLLLLLHATERASSTADKSQRCLPGQPAASWAAAKHIRDTGQQTLHTGGARSRPEERPTTRRLRRTAADFPWAAFLKAGKTPERRARKPHSAGRQPPAPGTPGQPGRCMSRAPTRARTVRPCGQQGWGPAAHRQPWHSLLPRAPAWPLRTASLGAPQAAASRRALPVPCAVCRVVPPPGAESSFVEVSHAETITASPDPTLPGAAVNPVPFGTAQLPPQHSPGLRRSSSAVSDLAATNLSWQI